MMFCRVLFIAIIVCVFSEICHARPHSIKRAASSDAVGGVLLCKAVKLTISVLIDLAICARVVSLAFLIYPVYAERPAVARIAMIAITTMSSIRVNPECLCGD
jgi:hypothetical protein